MDAAVVEATVKRMISVDLLLHWSEILKRLKLAGHLGVVRRCYDGCGAWIAGRSDLKAELSHARVKELACGASKANLRHTINKVSAGTPS